jgi:hypothetical protein
MFGLGGCDRFLQLETVPEPAFCPAPVFDPNGDADGDGEPNSSDPCPLVPHESLHDEDGDGVPDACDPCPPRSPDVSDFDCDGVGDLCDPDNSIPDTLEFFGFGDATGVVLGTGATLANDDVHLAFTTNNFAGLHVAMPVTPTGTYETELVVANLSTTIRCDAGVRFEAADRAYGAVLVGGTPPTLEIDEFLLTARNVIAAKNLKPVGASARVNLQVTVSGTHIHAAITGDVQGGVDGDAPFLGDQVTYGVAAHVNAAPDFAIDSEYLMRVAPR